MSKFHYSPDKKTRIHKATFAIKTDLVFFSIIAGVTFNSKL